MKKTANPFQRFISLESTSSLLLFVAALVAIFWANSANSASYFSIWKTQVSLGVGTWSIDKPLILWINDGLMAIFFFVIGLEIKKEILAGELSSIQKASLPLFAAVGGMVVPITLFLLLNGNGVGKEGWGIPMATDIAFSLGILQLLGKRVPLSLKIFLTAFAIVDDLGAVLVITFFYSTSILWIYLIAAFGILLLLFVANYLNINHKWTYILGGIGVWYLFLKSGIHPTIAGVLLAFTIPGNRKIEVGTFQRLIKIEIENLNCTFKKKTQFLTKPQKVSLETIETLTQQAQPMLQHFETRLHGFVAFVIMPIFALANAGVELFPASNSASGFTPLSLNLAEAMLLGKISGISLFSGLAIKMGFSSLPAGVNFKHIIGVSILGGFGFTMALFIESLAYTDPDMLTSGKIGILIGSVLAGILGYAFLRVTLKKEQKRA